MITIDNPTGGHSQPTTEFAWDASAIRAPSQLEGSDVVLFGNNKPNVDLLYETMATLLSDEHHVGRTAVLSKLSAAFPAPPDVVDEVAAYQIAVNGVGD
jgi:hypothetical protein